MHFYLKKLYYTYIILLYKKHKKNYPSYYLKINWRVIHSISRLNSVLKVKSPQSLFLGQLSYLNSAYRYEQVIVDVYIGVYDPSPLPQAPP